jgi:hypothetical protein
MPYIITTLNTTIHGEPMEDQAVADVDGATRTAVATLDEARIEARIVVATERAIDGASEQIISRAMQTADTLPESGGTIGPLPDGTVIEVREMTYEDIDRSRRSRTTRRRR